MTNRQIFYESYRRHLVDLACTDPEYIWIRGKANDVADKMIAAMDKRTFNKDGKAFKLTCKELGINHTYKAIFEYWNS